MTPLERIQCVLAGRSPDRPPVSFWHHFGPDHVHGPDAVAVHVAHVDAFELDFLKVMNDNAYPHAGRVESVEDLASLAELRGDEGGFARQLDLIADLKRALRRRVLITTTVFNVWATLRRLVRPRTVHGPPQMKVTEDMPSGTIRRLFTENPQAVRTAVRTLGTSLANFARRCLVAGADGIFLSVRDDWIAGRDEQPRLYEDLVRASDLQILHAAAAGRLNMLHVCGKAVGFGAFAAYPVHAINWADRAAGPSIAEASRWVKPTLCAGVDNLATLPEGTPDDCAREIADALGQAGGRPIIIGPGCTYDPDRVPPENLRAVCLAARR